MSTNTDDMVVINDVRYRYGDARRLGLLPADGKVVTKASKNVRDRKTEAPQGVAGNGKAKDAEDDSTLLTTGAGAQGAQGGEDDGDKGEDERPARNASTADWTAYALAHGKTEEDLAGLKRDEISELFPDTAE